MPPPLPPRVRIRKTPPAPRTLTQRIIAYVLGSTAAGYLLSLALHGGAAIALSIVLVRGMPGMDSLNTLIVTQGEESDHGAGFEQVLDTSIDFSGGETSSAEEAVAVAEVQSESAIPLPDIHALADTKNDGKTTGKGEGNQSGDGQGSGGFARPVQGKAVTKGSFTVWTVPEDPSPREDYLIVIQVELPGNRRLRWGDITGQVVGTDGYTQPVSQYHKFTRYVSKANQVVVYVPGAERLVKDVIQVRSRTLAEAQTLEIVF